MTELKNPSIEIKTENGIVNSAKAEFVDGKVILSAPNDKVCQVILRFKGNVDEHKKILGDDWERSYGTLEWRGIVSERVMPWYFCISDDKESFAAGVKTQASSMCYWQIDKKGITLHCDVRSGADGVELGDRKLICCEVVSENGEDAFKTVSALCLKMCEKPLEVKEPVYGGNNWYYAYGNSSAEEMLSDAEYISSLAGDNKNRPFMVMDDGWQLNAVSGPWNCGNEKHPDMKKLAEQMKEKGVKPGIWTRLLNDRTKKLPANFYRTKAPINADGDLYLDPSVPEVLDYVKETVSRFVNWGYQLIKHDFSTFDITGLWGFEMRHEIVRDDVHFFDRTKTTAEIIVNFYKAIKEAAGDAYILGCNCMGHLCAGLVHIQRTGDDTSGKNWERTRRMGINTLAFRMPQHGRFFEIDADCIGITDAVPWELNKEWINLLADSSTPLFVSVKPYSLREAEESLLKEAFKKAAVQNEKLVPIDWKETTCPEKYLLNGKEKNYDFTPDEGILIRSSIL